MSENVYLNGNVIPRGEAKVSAFDAGLLHGASAFTTMLARAGRVFRLQRHLHRLMHTVSVLDLRTDATAENLEKAVYQLLSANELSDARVRVTLTPGAVGRMGEGEQDEPPTTLITAEPLPEYPSEWYEKGIGVVISPFKQLAGDPAFGFKTGCYMPRVLARKEAAAKGYDEALWFTTENLLAEACFCNVFLVREGEVRTPPVGTPVLPGVVREAVIELCEQLDLPCDADAPLTIDDVLAAEEIFLTSSTAGIRPVARVEKHPVGDDKPGVIARKLMEAYEQLLVSECGPREQ
ncbi:MAG: aminotransferase class IV [Phycisphaerae bacterium]